MTDTSADLSSADVSTSEISFLDLLPEIYTEGAGGEFLARLLRPLQEAFGALLTEIEGAEVEAAEGPAGRVGGLPDLFDLARTPPPAAAALHADGEAFAFAALAFLAGWLGLPLRPAPARSVDWNRAFLQRALPLLALRGTLPGIDGLLRAWLDGDIVDPSTGPAVLVTTDLGPAVNGGPSAFQLGQAATLGVDTVLGIGPEAFLVVDVVLRPDEPLLRHPVGVDSVRLAALALLEGERPVHVHGELRIRGHPMQLAPAGPPAGWSPDDAGGVCARLGAPQSAEPDGTALLWGDPLVVRFPDETRRSTAW